MPDTLVTFVRQENMKMASKKQSSKTTENFLLIGIFVVGALLIMNQIALSSISSSYHKIGGGKAKSSLFGSGKDISNADISEVTSTQKALATVFPELKDASDSQDVVDILLLQGTPDYGEALGVSFDEPVKSMEYLAKMFPAWKDDTKKNNPEMWERYLNLAAKPHGISCEYCCGIGPQGADENGESKCGCQHNPALLALTLGLLKNTDYTDAQILREVMHWKAMFFPKNMVDAGLQVAGKDASEIKELPGMVGGC